MEIRHLTEAFADEVSQYLEQTTINSHRLRVLIADSNATVRKVLRLGLDPNQFEVIEATSGPEVLEAVTATSEPHAILLDSRLGGGMNGLEVCRELKSNMQYRSIPVVMLTGTKSNEEINNAIDAGADEFLSKPISRGELQVRMRSITRFHQANSRWVDAESIALCLARAVAGKDGYSSGHVEQVANFAVSFGRYIGLDPSELESLRYGAILHNVGKIGIPDEILEKVGPLTSREQALFRQHPRIGCDICRPLKPLADALPIIRHHKEHFDGTGYPDGLRGDSIPLKAQIVGIVDVYSALINDRPYREALTPIESVEVLRRRGQQGIHDPHLVDQFMEMLAEMEAARDARCLGTRDTQPIGI